MDNHSKRFANAQIRVLFYHSQRLNTWAKRYGDAEQQAIAAFLADAITRVEAKFTYAVPPQVPRPKLSKYSSRGKRLLSPRRPFDGQP